MTKSYDIEETLPRRVEVPVWITAPDKQAVVTQFGTLNLQAMNKDDVLVEGTFTYDNDNYVGSARIDIPPGERAYKVTDHFTVPVDVDAIGVIPHAHYVCRSMYAYAVLPGGERRTLLRIPEWNFNWQQQYRFNAPIRLPEDT
jgi:hypothetical protein